jgi:UDP-N-acetyl-D-mannosaminuronate dehydrogenase
MNSFSRICVVGLDHVGLPTVPAFAGNGLDVGGVELSLG